MNRPRVMMITALVLALASPVVLAGCTSSKGAKSVSISADSKGNGLVVAVSESLARSLLEEVVGADLKCGAEIDDEFAAMLRKLDRGGRGSRATLRDDDSVITAHRSGRSLKMDIRDSDDGSRLEVKMPWAVAECLLDGSASLTGKDAGSIRVKLVGSDGGSFEFKID